MSTTDAPPIIQLVDGSFASHQVVGEPGAALPPMFGISPTGDVVTISATIRPKQVHGWRLRHPFAPVEAHGDPEGFLNVYRKSELRGGEGEPVYQFSHEARFAGVEC